jgi:hypothetical protein
MARSRSSRSWASGGKPITKNVLMVRAFPRGSRPAGPKIDVVLERNMSYLDGRLTRRGALKLGGGAAAGTLLSGAALAEAAPSRDHGIREQRGKLPAKQIQEIVQAQGTVTNGVLSIPISRDDIGPVHGPLGVVMDGSFEVDGALTFQPLGDGLAFFNADLPLKAEETDGFIDAIGANGMVFQAFHMHYTEQSPQTWFIHWRGLGAPLTLARAAHNVLKSTATKLPQTVPSKPTSPLDAKRLGKILGGQAMIGSNGVVTVNVSRGGRIVIDGVHASPEANISTGIEFKPLASSGSKAAAGPDFAMTGREVMPVVKLMRSKGWYIGCLYNQETEEYPQLYFAHMLKTGDAYQLAAEIRVGLEKTDVDFM